MNSYAICITCNKHYFPGVVSIVNGLAAYKNEVDVHLSVMDTDKQLLEVLAKAPSNVRYYDWSTLVKDERWKFIEDPKKVRFARYHLAETLCDRYKVVLILDADMCIVDHIMMPFELCSASKELVSVKNPLGFTISKATIENVNRSFLPPFHCTGTFFNCERHKDILSKTFDRVFTDTTGDMIALFRTLKSLNYDFNKIIPLHNEEWILTQWYRYKIDFKNNNGIPELRLPDDRRVKAVHGRWYLPEWFSHDVAEYKTPNSLANAESFKKSHELLQHGVWHV
jgi:lipopolysaccharide biosynthesis glycosyltransferase